MLKIKVNQDNNKTLLEILRETDNYLPAICADRGNCGKCRVKIIKGSTTVTEADRNFFSQEELQEGWRLACKCIPKEELCIETDRVEGEDFQIVGVRSVDMETAEGGADIRLNGNACERENIQEIEGSETYILGIDIGTTTIAMALQNIETGRVVKEYLALNRQRMYGADVVSRIQKAVQGNGIKLQMLVREDLWKGIWQITHNGAIMPRQVVIAANTTMVHLLMGYSCGGLGQYPFTPYHIGEVRGTLGDMIGDCTEYSRAVIKRFQNVPAYILPGISAFVGGDIVADMLECNIAQNARVCALIDIGTNGEMVVGNRDKILVTSTSAGPAFEGGNIAWGTGSIPGAICGMEIREHKESFGCHLNTIKGQSPIGICGTGAIEIIYELLQAQIIDETGYMETEKFLLARTEKGENIDFSQGDVRQIQLAKSAIRAGVEILLLRYGIAADEIDTVYLTGGFGYHIHLDKAIGIGLLPESFRGKIKVPGNSALRGALQCGRILVKGSDQGKIDRYQEICEEISLAQDKIFGELFLKHLNF